ncbi:hypothetical protein DSO57_1010599 [Entomophthora muscae]|uniref:Uncharacterized protein n=1 Tax=Entomophthora muscae TaxID=34485 RepID=A0ACC2UR88_9FUNG|nr:hypothetical protein DSO57_1010599 [Entomophthora muscae]
MVEGFSLSESEIEHPSKGVEGNDSERIFSKKILSKSFPDFGRVLLLREGATRPKSDTALTIPVSSTIDLVS